MLLPRYHPLLLSPTTLPYPCLRSSLAPTNARMHVCEDDAERLRVLLERSRFAAVAEAAAARAKVSSLDSDLTHARAELASTSAALAAATDAHRCQGMELEGANAQLRVCGCMLLRQLVLWLLHAACCMLLLLLLLLLQRSLGSSVRS